jgi:hypothetical protein
MSKSSEHDTHSMVDKNDCSFCQNVRSIPRIHSVTWNDFYARYALTGHPVIIVDAMRHWKLDQLSMSSLASVYAAPFDNELNDSSSWVIDALKAQQRSQGSTDEHTTKSDSNHHDEESINEWLGDCESITVPASTGNDPPEGSEQCFFPYGSKFRTPADVFAAAHAQQQQQMNKKNNNDKGSSPPWYVGWCENSEPLHNHLRVNGVQWPYFIPRPMYYTLHDRRRALITKLNHHDHTIDQTQSQRCLNHLNHIMNETRPFIWLFMGEPGHGAQPHMDTVGAMFTWQAQIMGTKQWTLSVPDQETIDGRIIQRDPQCGCRSHTVILKPGEIIVIDTDRWTHATKVLGTEFSFAIGAEYYR